MNDMDGDRDHEPFKRFDFNHAPPKQSMKCNVNDVHTDPKNSQRPHALGEDFDKRQNSTNSNSPISVTSLDDGDSKNCNVNQTLFYSTHHGFNDDKSSGTSSLFSSGI